jgi:hypothetical protein
MIVDRWTTAFWGVYILFGCVWFYRAYRGTKLEQHLVTLTSPEPRRMIRSDRIWAISLGCISTALGIVWLVKAYR